MSSDLRSSSPPMWELPDWLKGSVANPLDVFAAPQNLVQPIQSGWVFGSVTNITEQNSSAPETEREIVANQSYGRQLGHVMDALAVLIADSPRKDDQAFKEFTMMREEIDAIKTRAAVRRIERIVADLKTLKDKKSEDHDRLVAALREALK
jgi:hypothetical protein